MLKEKTDGTTKDMSPKLEKINRNVLVWRTPTDHPCDPDDAIAIANGFGGRYSVDASGDEFILWLDDDEFAYKTFATVDKCKRYAECRFQHKLRKLYAKLSGKDQTTNPQEVIR